MNIPTIFKGILVATVIGSLIALALNYQPSVAAQSDTTPPVVTGVSVSPQVLDTSQSAQTTQVVYTATDDISGVAHTIWYTDGLVFTSPSGAQEVKINAGTFVLTSGTSLDGSHSATATFPQYAESGVWQLTRMLVEDGAGNLLNIGSGELASLGVSASVEIVSVVPGATPTPTATPTPIPLSSPVAYSQEVSTTAGVPVSITLTGSDVNEDTLGWAIVEPVIGGTTEYVTMSQTTNTIDVVFTPNAGFIGTGSFKFYATDSTRGIIVGVAVTSAGTDAGQAAPHGGAGRQANGTHPKSCLMNVGFATREDITALEQRSVTVYTPVRLPRNRPEQERYQPHYEDGPMLRYVFTECPNSPYEDLPKSLASCSLWPWPTISCVGER